MALPESGAGGGYNPHSSYAYASLAV